MHVFEMVLGIVFIVGISSVFKHYFDLKRARLQVETEGGDPQWARLEELEERVKVLESIVTDKSYALKREIESL